VSADLRDLPRLTRVRTDRLDTEPVWAVVLRERYAFLGTYYRWCATRPWPTLPGNDPVTGRPSRYGSDLDHRMARAAYIALAREALAIARSLGPSPLP